MTLCPQAVNNSYCPFYVLPFCEVNNYTVSSTQEPWFSVGIRYPTPDGNPAAAAQRLGCLVHDVRFLTCSWQVGSEAPGDVQYRLFLQDLGTYQLEECPQYGVDARGTHVRCQFTNVSRLGGHVQVLVNGSSPSTRVPCSELTVEPGEIERLSLPKISGTCNQSYSTMEWKVFSYFHHRFRYELEIQKGSDPPYTEQLLQNSYVLPNPGTYVARLRAGKFFRTVWSEWSAPQRFDCDSGDDLHFRDWLTTALILLGALLTVGLGVVLCGRSLPPTDKRTLGPRCCPGTPSVLGSLVLAAPETLPPHPPHEGPHQRQPAEQQAGDLGGQQSKPGGLPGGGELPEPPPPRREATTSGMPRGPSPGRHPMIC
uniref:Interleukin-3 receptor subunit alpha n=1 Tax=Suricata suricatta TaxID=37032 RepID=A0A673VSN7_SURSU